MAKALKNPAGKAQASAAWRARCDNGCYVRALLCEDDSDSDLWMLAGDANDIGAFKLDGVCYYFGAESSICVPGGGTEITTGDVTAFVSCEACGGGNNGASCADCAVGTTPLVWTATVAGVLACPGFAGAWNGTFSVTQDTPCEWLLGDEETGEPHIEIGTVPPFIICRVRWDGESVFLGTLNVGVSPNCRGPFVIHNSKAVGDCDGTTVFGYDGTVTITG